MTTTRLDRAAASRQANAAIVASASTRRAPALPESFPPDFPPPTAISEQLFAANLDLANASANRWAAKCPMPVEDLESITRQGLLRGCRKYDPTRINPATGEPYAISSVVCPFIEGEVLHWFRDSKTYAVKFPSPWRKAWGRVQRMTGAGATAAEISAATGLAEAEIVEMISAMAGTIPLEEGLVGGAEHDPLDNITGALRRLADRGTDKLNPQDQELLKAWWPNNRRRALPTGPLQWFIKGWQGVSQGRKVAQFLQAELSLAVTPCNGPVVPVSSKAPRRQRVEAETLPLLGVVGK